MAGRTTGIRLPQSIVEQIGAAEDRNRGRPGRKPQASRKDARKQARVEKKQRKDSHSRYPHHHATPPSANNTGKRIAENDHPESPQRKKAKLSDTAQRTKHTPQTASLSKNNQTTLSTKSQSSTSKPKTALEKLVARADPASVPKSQAEKDDDTYISYLESMLGGAGGGNKSGKQKSKSFKDEFDDDGLGDLLADLDNIGAPTSQPISKFNNPNEESELEEASVDEQDDGESEHAVTGDDDDEDEEHGPSAESDNSSDDEEAPKPLPAPSSSTSQPVPPSRYVPPHLRNKTQDSNNSEDMVKLTRQFKGLLNRMSEQNISTILDDIEESYRKHRRHDITSCLTTLIIDGISSHSILLDSYVVLHAALVSSLHRIVGVEFGASFVQTVVATYEKHYATLQSPSDSQDDQTEVEETRGKECSNLIVLLSELYNFQVISCVLIYDIIRSLLNDLNEFNVELLLKSLRNSGQQLRQDDPSALKDIIQIVQNKVAENPASSSSRTRFMIETLVNLKNNKSKRAATQHAGGDAVERLKKFLSGLAKKRHLMAHDPLRVTLADLHSAESKGKWWLVGAAWGGDPLAEHQESAATARTQANNGTQDEQSSTNVVTENALLKLARKQGMNTDIRRRIFMVLMSSDDYMDACERLTQLGLTEIQQREIVRVILHCCGNEKAYNPYYTFIFQHLCRSSHSYKVTLQFCLWDFLRDLGETNVGGAEVIKSLKDEDGLSGGFGVKSVSATRSRNVALAYAWLITKDAITLAILKPVDFTVIKPQTHTFLREFFTALFLSTQSSRPVLSLKPNEWPRTKDRRSLEEVFIKVARIQALAMGLVYFLADAFGEGAGLRARALQSAGGDHDEGGFLRWASQNAVDTLRTGMDVVSSL